MDELEKIRKEKLKKLESKFFSHKNTKIEVTDNNFEEEVINRSKEVPVVVDFWATWCMPCLILTPILEKLVDEYNGKFILAKMNVDGNPITSQKYGIMSIPTVKLFKNGEIADEFIGTLPEPYIRQWFDKNIKK